MPDSAPAKPRTPVPSVLSAWNDRGSGIAEHAAAFVTRVLSEDGIRDARGARDGAVNGARARRFHVQRIIRSRRADAHVTGGTVDDHRSLFRAAPAAVKFDVAFVHVAAQHKARRLVTRAV